MALYGFSVFYPDAAGSPPGEVYGLPGFGARAGLGFSAAPVTAEPLGEQREGQYGQVRVEWSAPVGDWTRVRVTRRFTGFPVSADDGTIVDESSANENVTSIIDSGLVGGVAVYYTIFVLSESEVWFRAGSAWTIVVADYDFHALLQEALPDAAISSDYEASRLLSEDRKYPLRRLLEVIAFELDRAKSFIAPLEHLYDPTQTPADGVSLLVSQFGITPEPSIGITRLRSLAANAAYLNSKRGTKPGVEAFASAFTGWGATLTDGVNLMLDEDHTTVWTLDGTATFLDAADAPVSDAHWGILMGDTAAVRLRTAEVAGRERFNSIPVSPSTAYTFSLEVYSDAINTSATTEDVTMFVRTYEADGTFIAETADGTPTSSVVDSWTAVEATFTTEANAAFLEVGFSVTGGASGHEHFFKNLQLEEGSSASTYEPYRQTTIEFEPPYTNHITTPSFENSGTVTPAFTVTNATTSHDSADPRYGTENWSVVPTTLGVDTVVESDDSMPVQAGDPAMFRASVKPITTALDVTAELIWLDGLSSEISRTSQTLSLTPDLWNDLFLIEQAPGSAESVKVSLTWQDVTVHLDGVALVDTYGVQYFDGSTLSGETYWEGVGNSHNAVSYYYPLRQVKRVRLEDVLPNFMPLNRSFDLKFAESV